MMEEIMMFSISWIFK